MEEEKTRIEKIEEQEQGEQEEDLIQGKEVNLNDNKEFQNKIRRPLSAWMIYSNENRKLIKELNPEYGFKEISRALSEGFKSLTDEERNQYDKKAEEDKERYNTEIKLQHEYLAKNPQIQITKTPSSNPQNISSEIIFPLARIKKTVKYDNDVRNIQKEAIVVVSKATELFLTYLSSRAFQVASRKKRKTIKDSDLIEVIHSQELLKFLQTDFPKQSMMIAKKEDTSEDTIENKDNSTNSTNIDSVRKYFKPTITEFTET